MKQSLLSLAVVEKINTTMFNEKITSLSPANGKHISLEVNSNQLLDINQLASMTVRPDFVAVTWIGHFEKEHLEEIPPIKMAKELISKGFIVLLHIPSRNLNRTTALEVLNVIKDIGVRNVLALKGQTAFIREVDDSKVDFPYASQFVEFIKQNFHDYFAIGVTGYPEKHPDSYDSEEDMNYLKLKVSKGADFIVTQASLDNSMYEKFLERCMSHSIYVPIFVGTVIVTSREELKILEKVCKITLSDETKVFLEKHVGNELVESFSRRKFLDLGEKILKNKSFFAGIHIFSLTNSELSESLIYDLNKGMT